MVFKKKFFRVFYILWKLKDETKERCSGVAYNVKIKLLVIWKISFTDIFANLVSCITIVIKAFCRGQIKSWPHAPLNTSMLGVFSHKKKKKKKRHNIKRHIEFFNRLLCENIGWKKIFIESRWTVVTSNIFYFKNIYFDAIYFIL